MLIKVRPWGLRTQWNIRLLFKKNNLEGSQRDFLRANKWIKFDVRQVSCPFLGVKPFSF